MGTQRQDIRTLSVKHSRLETLINHVNYETLAAEHRRQEKGKAVGVDKVTKEEYGGNLRENLQDLLKRMKSFFYKPQPARRAYIPKANGKKRPLGIPSYEDKLVQGVMAYMAGSTLKDREDRQSRVGICEEIEVIAVVEEISRRIPAPIGIGL